MESQESGAAISAIFKQQFHPQTQSVVEVKDARDFRFRRPWLTVHRSRLLEHCPMVFHPFAVHFPAHCMFTRLSILAGLSHISRKLAVATWSYSCFRKGRGRSESNTVIFHSNPPSLSSWGILRRSWKIRSRWSRAQILAGL